MNLGYYEDVVMQRIGSLVIVAILKTAILETNNSCENLLFVYDIVVVPSFGNRNSERTEDD